MVKRQDQDMPIKRHAASRFHQFIYALYRLQNVGLILESAKDPDEILLNVAAHHE